MDPIMDEWTGRNHHETDDVVEIRRGSAATVAPQFAALLQFADGTGIRRVTIHIDDSRPEPLASRQGEPQEKLCGLVPVPFHQKTVTNVAVAPLV
jgi:hypothetical protein